MVGRIEIKPTSHGRKRRRVSKSRDRWSRHIFVRRRTSLGVGAPTPDANWQAIEVRTNGTAAGNVTSQTVWSAAYINAPILQDSFSNGTIQPDSRIYFLHDANWDTTAVVGYDATSGTWNVVQRYVYSPYGSLTILNPDFSTPAAGTQPMTDHLYQGMSLDPVTGLYYERNRNYSPSLGVWTSQDPLQYVNGANTYQFVGSSPVGMVDAEGTSLWTGLGNLLSELSSLAQSALAIYNREISELKTRQALDNLPPYLRTYNACKLKLPPLRHGYNGPVLKKLTGGFGEGHGNMGGSVYFPIGGTPIGIGLSGSSGLSGTGPAIRPNKGMFKVIFH